MRIYPEKLPAKLAADILPLYIVSGDEPLLVQESTDVIRKHFKNLGFAEREIFHVDSKFDWQSLKYANESMSLFSNKKIIELRMGSIKPGKQGALALADLCQNLLPENCVLLTMPKVDSATQKTKWFKTLDKVGGIVQIWPIEKKMLPNWVANRFRLAGLEASKEAVLELTDRIEGNLLVAVQEIERMKLCATNEKVGSKEVLADVADATRFDVFQLIDAALEGKIDRVIRIIETLRLSDLEPLFLTNMLAREIRSLSSISFELDLGQSLEAAMRSRRIWDKRKSFVSSCLERHCKHDFERFQVRLTRVDRMIKGIDPSGKPWDEITNIVTKLASESV